jgi:phosphate transport system permease protein
VANISKLLVIFLFLLKTNETKRDFLATKILLGFVTLVFLLLALLFGFIIWFSLPVFFAEDSQVFSLLWRPEHGHYGILPMIVGSGILAFSALCLALPIALGVSGFCLFSRHQKAASWIRYIIRLMAGIPTVVYGVAAIFLLVPLLRDVFGKGAGFCLLGAVLMIVMLILPVMVMILDAQFLPMARRVYMTATALGMTESQAILHVVIPHSAKGLATAAILGFSRAIGDTMLPLMIAGNAPQIPGSVFDSMRTLTAHIGLVLSTEEGSAVYNSLFAAGMLLLGMSLVVTLLTRGLEQKQIHQAGENF